MGVGKTRLAKRLSSKLQIKRIDLDQTIEDHSALSIPELFAQHGEAHFRQIEHEQLIRVASLDNQIISCGGGTPVYFDNMEIIKQNGLCIYLKASPEVIFRHLKVSKTKRPLLENKTDEELLSFITKKLEERSPIYNQAHIVVDTQTELHVLTRIIREWWEG
jgi:shikimate kinase